MKNDDILFYHEAWIRALFNFTSDDISKLGLKRFTYLIAAADEIKKFWHLPFRESNK